MTSPFNDPRVSGVFDRAFGTDVRRDWPDYTRFTPWMPLTGTQHPIWSGDEKNTIGAFQGIYVAALFPSLDAIPEGPADPFDPSVVYIGRTKTATLTSRWGQFKSAVRGDGGHSGGNTFYATHVETAGDAWEDVLARTRLAGLPVWLGRVDDSRTKDIRRICFRTALLESALVEAVYAHKAANGGAALLNKA